jgi:hypothetical protein
VALWLTRLLGLVLVAFAVLPIFRLLDHAGTGLAGSATSGQLDIYYDMLWAGLLLVVPLFIIGALLIPDRFEDFVVAAGRRLASIPAVTFAAVAALLSLCFGVLFVLLVLDGLPNLIDSHAQLMHARFWASGMLAGPTHDGGGFWAMQNALFTDRGWVSQYPPGHIGILALFLRLGVPWLAGPVLMAATVFFAVLFADRLFADRPGLGRFAAIVLAVSPFFIAIGASYMNHVSAAAGVMIGAYGLLRAWQDRPSWALLAGAGFGFALTTRPLSTVAMAAALAALMPFMAASVGRWRNFVRVNLVTAAGAAPFAALLLAYNQYFFGHPLRFGYNVVLGPLMSLGFHQDPWGNTYGLREAVGYTSSDLLALGVNLLESPLSAVLVIGLFFMVQPRLAPATRVLAAWALAPVVANFFYWHHGLFMGPRMLHEALPAWAMLFAVATAGLIAWVPSTFTVARLRVRSGLLFTFVVGLGLSLTVLAPQRLSSYGGDWLPIMRTPEPDAAAAALIFVHDSWTARSAMTLAAHRYRLDLIETIIRQNSTCSLHHLAAAVAAGNAAAERVMLASLDTVPTVGRLMQSRELAPGTHIRIAPGEYLSGECERQAASDRRGTLALEPLLWRGAAPGSRATGVHYVRDLGPERNASLIAQYPGFEIYVYTTRDAETLEPILLPYDQAMVVLWRSPAGALSTNSDNGIN